MIGGFDIVIDSVAEPEAVLEKVYLLLLSSWPMAVVEDGITGELLMASETHAAFSGRSEIMVYRDAAARKSWETYEAEPFNFNTMIHVLAHPGMVTLVVDDPNDPVAKRVIENLTAFVKEPHAAPLHA